MINRFYVVLLLVMSFIPILAFGDDRDDRRAAQIKKLEDQKKWDDLQEFKKQMDQAPKSWLSKTNENVQILETKFKDKAGQVYHDFRSKKDDLKVKLTKDFNRFPGLDDPEGKAAQDSKNDAKNLVDNTGTYLNKLEDMERSKLTAASLDELAKKDKEVNVPWSDDYWAIYRGILGARYVTSGFDQRFSPWTFYKNLVANYTLSQVLGGVVPEGSKVISIDDLSPSEKYDLITGTVVEGKKGALTEMMWKETEGSQNSEGQVETWMGICHGWAPAAYMLKRPLKPVTGVTVKLPSGKTKDITLYPADIKALASLLYARSNFSTKFVGRRCNAKDSDIKKDPKTGRILDLGCFDIFPSTWHMAAVNQIGVAHRSFVMDATFDYEVWNQPVESYSYSYFNPATGKQTKSLKDATVPYAAFASKDKFGGSTGPRAVRNREAGKEVDKLVGVMMDVTYVVEVQPQHLAQDGVEQDGRKTVQYVYDLEINKKGEIIGGEWYNNAHPDFLWTPAKDVEIRTAEAGLKWDGHAPLDAKWTTAALNEARDASSAKPLATVVETLIKRSRGEL